MCQLACLLLETTTRLVHWFSAASRGRKLNCASHASHASQRIQPLPLLATANATSVSLHAAADVHYDHSPSDQFAFGFLDNVNDALAHHSGSAAAQDRKSRSMIA